MRLLLTTFALQIALVAVPACSVATDDEPEDTAGEEIRGAANVEIDVSPKTEDGKVDERVFGTNMLYWIENDARLSDGKLRTELAGAGVKMLRFPGGTVSNNYDWRTNALDDPSIFPRSSDPVKDPIERTSYVELLDFMSGLPGAEANFVVNIEGAYRETPRARAKFLKRAADWVADANVVRRRGVRYWEIGNEEYFSHKYMFTAPEYAAEVIDYANAMKVVDPTIRIGAVGPFSATDGSFLDQLTPNGLAKFRGMSEDELDAKEEALGSKDAFADWLNEGVKVTPRSWWDVVAEKAGSKIDFIVLHRYDATRAKGDFSKKVTIADTVDDIRKVVAKRKGGAFEVSMTEYNVANENDLSPNQHCVVMAEQIMHLMQSHVAFANIWPLQLGGNSNTLMSLSNEAKPELNVFGDIAKHVGKHLLRSKVVSGEQVDVVATADWRTATRDVQRTVIVVNRARAARSAHVAHLPGKVSRAVQYHASNANGGVDRSTLSPRNPKGTNDVYLKLQPLSITVLTMSGDN